MKKHVDERLRLIIHPATDRGLQQSIDDQIFETQSIADSTNTRFNDGACAWHDASIYGIITSYGGRRVATFVNNILADEMKNHLKSCPSLTKVPTTVEEEWTDEFATKFFEAVFETVSDRVFKELPSATREGCGILLVAFPRIEIRDSSGEKRTLTSRIALTVNLGDALAYLCRVGNVEDLNKTTRDGLEVHGRTSSLSLNSPKLSL